MQMVGISFQNGDLLSKKYAHVDSRFTLITRCLRVLLGMNAFVATAMTLAVTMKTLEAGAGKHKRYICETRRSR